MYVVAIHQSDPSDPTRPAALATVLGVTAYDARSRVNTPGPCVVSCHQDVEAAKERLRALQAAGFATLARDTEQIDREALWFEAHAFELADDHLLARGPGATSLQVPYEEIAALLRGIRVDTQETTETVKGRKFSAKRAVLSGGLVMTRKTTKTVSGTEDSREGFLHVFAGARPVCVFRETGVRYEGLPNKQLTRAAGFLELIGELRARAPAARYDERLLKRIAQQQLLGATPDVCDLVRLASALVAGSLAKS